MKNIDLTPIIEAFIAIISLLIIPKLKAYLAEKLSAEQMENLKKWVKVAVAAAEQMYKGSGLGEKKYRYVVSFLEEKGFYVNYKEIEALVESEVYKLTKDYTLTFPDVGTSLSDNSVSDDVSEPAEVLNEYCGDGNGLSEDASPDEETEADEADESSLFQTRNACG